MQLPSVEKKTYFHRCCLQEYQLWITSNCTSRINYSAALVFFCWYTLFSVFRQLCFHFSDVCTRLNLGYATCSTLSNEASFLKSDDQMEFSHRRVFWEILWDSFLNPAEWKMCFSLFYLMHCYWTKCYLCLSKTQIVEYMKDSRYTVSWIIWEVTWSLHLVNHVSMLYVDRFMQHQFQRSIQATSEKVLNMITLASWASSHHKPHTKTDAFPYRKTWSSCHLPSSCILYFLEIKTKLKNKTKTLVCSGSQGGMSAPYRLEDSILKAHEYESDRAGDSDESV